MGWVLPLFAHWNTVTGTVTGGVWQPSSVSVHPVVGPRTAVASSRIRHWVIPANRAKNVFGERRPHHIHAGGRASEASRCRPGFPGWAPCQIGVLRALHRRPVDAGAPEYGIADRLVPAARWDRGCRPPCLPASRPRHGPPRPPRSACSASRPTQNPAITTTKAVPISITTIARATIRR